MSKTVTLRLSDETYQLFLEAAEAENRPISNLIETAAVYRLREAQFADDAEMAELEANARLRARLKAGSAEARKKRGRLVG